MSLLAALGFEVATGAGTNAAVPPKAGVRPGQKTKGGKSQVDFGEVKTLRVVKLKIGAIRWPGHNGELFAFADTEGRPVTNGNRAGWRSMATGNMMSGRIVHALVDLGQLENRWRGEAKSIQQATTAGLALLKRVEAARATFLKTKAKNAQFREAMKTYFKALDELPGIREQMVQATEKLKSALGRLGAEVESEKILKIEEDIQKTEGEIASVKAEAQAIKDKVGKVLDLAGSIAGFVTSPTPDKAIELLGKGIKMAADELIDGRFESVLQELDEKLKASTEALSNAKHAKHFHLISAAQAEVRAAISVCRQVDDLFSNKVKAVVISRADALDRTADQKETKVFGEAIVERARQRARIATSRVQCETFLKAIAPLADNVPKVRDKYAYVSDWIADVAVDDSRLAAGTAWASNAEWTGRHNAVELGNWVERVPTVTAECRKMLATLDDKGAEAATAPYNAAAKMVEDLLGESAAFDDSAS